MKKLLIVALTLSALGSTAQKTPNPTPFAKYITAEDLRHNLAIVAGADMEGRETATEGQRKAAAYIESQFKALGLLPGNNGSYQLPYDVYQDSLTGAKLEVNGKTFLLDRDFNSTIANNATSLRFSEVVVIGDNAMDSLRNANLAGRLVLITTPLPQGRGAAGGIYGALINKGVAAILSVSKNYPHATIASRKSPQSTSNFKRVQAPLSFTISEQVARAIIPLYDAPNENGNRLQTISANIFLDIKKTTLPLQSTDVIAYLPGTDLKDQYLFVTAHYDHLGKRDSVIYYGADDDGSGTVGVLQIAKAFVQAKAAGKGPRRTVVFMTVSGEEKGLWGSDYYSSHPVFSLDKTTADLNIDMIGRTDSSRHAGDSSNYVYVVGDDKLSSDLRPISEGVNRKWLKMELDYKYNDPNDRNRIYYRSDHYNFAKRGVPIIFYYDGMLGADYHRPTDTPDKINYTLLAKRAQLVFYTAWEMANRNDMLKRDIPLDTNVFNR